MPKFEWIVRRMMSALDAAMEGLAAGAHSNIVLPLHLASEARSLGVDAIAAERLARFRCAQNVA